MNAWLKDDWGTQNYEAGAAVVTSSLLSSVLGLSPSAAGSSALTTGWATATGWSGT